MAAGGARQGCSKVRPVEGRSCSAALKSEGRNPKPESSPKPEFREWPNSISCCSAGGGLSIRISVFGLRVSGLEWPGPTLEQPWVPSVTPTARRCNSWLLRLRPALQSRESAPARGSADFNRLKAVAKSKRRDGELIPVRVQPEINSSASKARTCPSPVLRTPSPPSDGEGRVRGRFGSS